MELKRKEYKLCSKKKKICGGKDAGFDDPLRSSKVEISRIKASK
jgi:hypothetical protein